MMYEFKELYTLDFRNVKNYTDMHRIIKRELDFPDYYGGNWDAFWDCVKGLIGDPIHIEILGLDVLERKFNNMNMAATIVEILREWKHYNDDKYAEYQGNNYSTLIEQGWRNLDHLTRSIYYASISLDDTQEMATHKEEFSTVIPAIWPIDRTKLRSVSSLYGMRKHPRYGTWRKHEGVDLAAPKGTPVYATGNAVVREARWRNGYGNLVELNHGFGYKTRYGHLHKIYVKEGDSVTRGQVIGEVGNTGVSEGAHLHYEVRFRNNTVNPIHYFNKDMSPEAYIELMNQIEESTSKN